MTKAKLNWKPLTVLTASLTLAACGGGGGGGSDPVAPAPAPSNPGSSPVTPSTPTSTTTVTGAVTKGPVAGATIELFRVDQFGNLFGDAVVTGVTTGADGSFSVQIDASITEDLIVVASGGSFVDESDTTEPRRSITLGATDTFLSVIRPDQTTVAITPVTTAAVLRGRVLAGADGTFADKFTAAKSALDAQAGFDILTTVPANPLNPGAATDAQKSYALLLGGIANLVNDVALSSGASAPTYDMVVAVTFDLVDGQIDGQYFGSTDIPGSTATPVSLPQDLNLAEEITRFRNNNFSNFGDVAQLPSIEVTTFGNTFPTAVAVANNNGEVPQGTLGTLDGGGSTDAESGVFYSWVQTAGTTVALSDAAAAAPTFTAPTRLIGNETLSFELTAIDTLGFTAVDSVNVTVVGALSNDFYVVDDNEIGDGVGTDVDGGGRLTLSATDTTGVLFAEGEFPFDYEISADETTLTINFPTPYLQDDFDEERDITGDGVTDGFFLIEERIDSYIFTLVTDNPNADALTITEVGNEVILDISGAPLTPAVPAVPISSVPDPITAYDIAQAQPFSIAAGDRRTLLYDSFNVIPTLTNDDELYHELFEFTTFDAATNSGTGSVRDSETNFSYSIDAAGNLIVEFSPTESAKYINLATRPTGDVVATEYTLSEPFFTGDPTEISDVRLSIPENRSIAKPTTRLDVAGVYSGIIEDPQDLVENRELFVRLNPDGTGSINFDGQANELQFFDFDGIIPFRSSFGVCWDLNADGDIVVDRTFSLNVGFPNSFSSETSTSLCDALIEENTDFQFNLTLMDIVPNATTGIDTYKFFDRREQNRCAFTPTADCTETPELVANNFQLRINEREVLTASPPVAFLDPVQTPDGTQITIDLLANDQARDLPIAGAVLGRGPFNGTIDSFDPTTGILVYTPDSGIRSDAIEYQAIDTEGNRSQQQITQIDINPCPTVNGEQAFFDIFTKDCLYFGIGGGANPALSDVNLGPLPDGGVHKFFDSLVIGQDFSSDADAAGITAGGQGPTLNIAAGTIVAFNDPSHVLSISRGSQINVGGTPTDPVIMTSVIDIDSQRDVANGGPGFQEYNVTSQWGGLAIQGFGITNTCAYTGLVSDNTIAIDGECHVPSPTGLAHYGGINNGDSSGAITYLQIRYAGGFSGSTEAKALDLAGVGSGTSISHVQVYSTFDDGIDLSGGAVDLQNVAVLYAKDDSLEIDEGYNGSISGALFIQDQLSGNLCVEADGIDDFTALTAADIESRITQGVNSRPVISNLTCVLSGPAGGFGDGAGLRFRTGTFVTMDDSLVIHPGEDDELLNSACLRIDDRSLDAALAGDLAIGNSIVACPDRTGGNTLPFPDESPTESFLITAGNIFATIPPGGAPAPTAAAGQGQNVLEGAPLIYSPAPADLVVDSAPVTPTPSTFVGAVQQGASDWTLDWTFGLHPDQRFRPLWYEGPVAISPAFVPASKGQVVTLDASSSVALTPGISFQWAQIDAGAPIVLSNPTGATTQFTTPGLGTNLTQSGGQVDIELIVTDDNGLQGKKVISVPVQPSIPAEFYSTRESLVPFQFNVPTEGGVRISINTADNTGLYKDADSERMFTWTDTDTTFTIDLSATPLTGAISTSSEDVDADPMTLEVVTRTQMVEQQTYTLLSDTGAKKNFQLSQSGFVSVFDDTNSVPLPDEPFTNEVVQAFNQAVVSVQDGISYEFLGGEVVSLPVNLSTAIPTVPVSLSPDLLTFNADGTGTALNKATGFNWAENAGILSVSFNDGESAEYILLFESNGTDAVGVTYTKTDTSTQSQVVNSVRSDPTATFLTQPQLAGIYKTNQRRELADGSFVSEQLFYRLHPDGTGQLELEVFDETGAVDIIQRSSRGICWQLDGVNNFVWSRTSAPEERHTGSVIPGLSTCSLINTAAPDNTLIVFQRQINLLGVNGSGQLLTYSETLTNQFDPFLMTGDNTILETTSTFLRNFDPVVLFNGSPPLAVPDNVIVLGVGVPETFAPAGNDLAGDSAIVPTSIVIEAQPKHGTIVIEANGDLTYTADPSFTTFDSFQYRVFDANGNSSTIGTVDIIDSGSA